MNEKELKDCADGLIDYYFEGLFENVFDEVGIEYDDFTNNEKKKYINYLRQLFEERINEKLKNIEKSKDIESEEILLFKRENKRLRYELEHAHDWDNYNSRHEMGQ